MPIIRRKKTIEELTAEVTELQTAMEAMWSIVKEKTGATEDDLDESIAQLSGSVKSRLQPKEVKRSIVRAEPTVIVEKPAEKPVVVEEEKPVVEETRKIEEPVAEEIVVEEPVAEEIIVEEPIGEVEDKEEVVEAEPEEQEQAPHPDAVKVKLRGDRVKCPTCMKVFSVRDVRFWDGEKCTVCNTHLIIEGIEDLVF